MNTSSIFGDMLQTIAERGRRLLSFAWQPLPADGVGDLERACRNLLSRRGEASGMALAGDILEHWRRAGQEDRRAFMMMLLEKFGPDPERLERAIDAYRAERSPKTLRELHVAAEPKRQELIRRLNLAPNGTATLVEMREALLDQKADNPDLEAVDADFSHLFGSWFNRGFLILTPIDWSAPANILEKIIRYEAVHEIGDWNELRRRLDPDDRRCLPSFIHGSSTSRSSSSRLRSPPPCPARFLTCSTRGGRRSGGPTLRRRYFTRSPIARRGCGASPLATS
jgi:malonyl-CoA decarboxylase